MREIRYEAQTKTIQDILNLHQNGNLNLEPGFQRASVWKLGDRARLIDSILRGYPLPAVFFYKRADERGRLVWDVIDGKQRIESILMFCGAIRGARFETKALLPGNREPEVLDWNTLRRRHQQHRITGYKLQIIEVEGEFSDVIDLFVRINSTGKALTSQEKRHAKYYHSPFLQRAAKLAETQKSYLVSNKVLSASQITRMKHVELLCELMLSAHTQDVLNKKSALDKVMASTDLTERQVNRSAAAVTTAINRLKQLLPKLAHTRFHQLADFYTVVVLLMQFEREGLALADRKRLNLGRELLIAFSTGVDKVKERQKKIENISEADGSYRKYLLTVLEGTDEVTHRRDRAEILRDLLASIFEKKDENRLFSAVQRRILWNSIGNRKCSACRKNLTWEDFTIDHIEPHSKGGRTALENAALMCRKHNSMKGNRRLRLAA